MKKIKQSRAKKVFRKIDQALDSCIITGCAIIVIAVSFTIISLKKNNQRDNKNV